MSDALTDRLNDLKAALRNLADSPNQFENLAYRIVALPLSRDRVIRAPEPSKDTLALWKQSTTATGAAQLSAVDMRNLCWHPDAAFDPEFSTQHRRIRSDRLGRKEVMGLVYCQLACWSGIVRRGVDVRPLSDWISGSDRTGYFDSIKCYLDPKTGTERFAKAMIRPSISVATELQKTFRVVTEGTDFAREIRLHYGVANSKMIFDDNAAVRRWFYSEILGHLTKELFVEVIGKAVESRSTPPPEGTLNDFRILLLEFKELGDPRTDGGQAKWKSVPDRVRKRISEWFSQEDIRLFFDLFIDDETDRQGRKEFWLYYAHLVQRTRVLVGRKDASRLSRLDGKIRRSAVLGTFDHSGAGSAFVMDFGSVVVVEFSLAGNACYVYLANSDASPVKSFWKASLTGPELRDKDRCAARLTHSLRWQSTFASELARLGVRQRKA